MPLLHQELGTGELLPETARRGPNTDQEWRYHRAKPEMQQVCWRPSVRIRLRHVPQDWRRGRLLQDATKDAGQCGTLPAKILQRLANIDVEVLRVHRGTGEAGARQRGGLRGSGQGVLDRLALTGRIPRLFRSEADF